ncbi:hypothetical protein EMQ25_09660 [Arsenicitalea aurantiaca]|uniref:Uncharacterized protein n=1 Tax=Arsenicitalea aurantiaca TaxID=1783274 RepID=A0A433XAU6_9HYPH|nr:hypothetical protein [Arsenicitalea aurantiaca]RUT31128.1 hypothetical protein EMQ25_09660 [Arsenicitalea aurantiaca]
MIRSPFASPDRLTGQDAETEAESEARRIALEYLAEAWNDAEDDGVDGQALAHAALFAALATLVEGHGEDQTASFAEKLADRIRAGEYTVGRTLQ